jgi:hypothetical protein
MRTFDAEKAWRNPSEDSRRVANRGPLAVLSIAVFPNSAQRDRRLGLPLQTRTMGTPAPDFETWDSRNPSQRPFTPLKRRLRRPCLSRPGLRFELQC